MAVGEDKCSPATVMVFGICGPATEHGRYGVEIPRGTYEARAAMGNACIVREEREPPLPGMSHVLEGLSNGNDKARRPLEDTQQQDSAGVLRGYRVRRSMQLATPLNSLKQTELKRNARPGAEVTFVKRGGQWVMVGPSGQAPKPALTPEHKFSNAQSHAVSLCRPRLSVKLHKYYPCSVHVHLGA